MSFVHSSSRLAAIVVGGGLIATLSAGATVAVASQKATGTTGVHVVTGKRAILQPGATNFAMVTCPKGEKVLGTGAYQLTTPGNGDDNAFYLSDISIFNKDRSVSVAGTNTSQPLPGGTVTTLRAQAVCAKVTN
jgi:hypothetical protein